MKVIIPDEFFEVTDLHGLEIEVTEILKSHPEVLLVALIKAAQKNLETGNPLESTLSMDLLQVLSIAKKELTKLRRETLKHLS